MGRMAWATKEEAALVTDASLMVQRKDGQIMKILPEQFLTNVIHVQAMYEKPTLSGYLVEQGITPSSSFGSPRPSASAATSRAPSPQKPTPVSTSGPHHPSPHSRVQVPMRPPPSPAPPRTQGNNMSPQPGSTAASPAPARPPASASSPVPPRMQENISPQPGSTSSSPAVHMPARPRATYPTLPHNPNPIVPRGNADAVKIGGGGGGAQSGAGAVNVYANGQSPLQTNGASRAAMYVPLSAGTGTNNGSLKLPSRPARPSAFAHSVVASQGTSSPSASRVSES